MKRLRNPLKFSFEKATHRQQISSLWFILILTVFTGLFYAFYFKFNALPDPNLSEDDSLVKFNARRAREYLTSLTQRGPKVAGSQLNEEYAVQYLLSELDKIRGLMHPNHELDVEVQVSNGSLHIESSTATYQGVQNVVVRLRNAKMSDPDTSLLINSHFDTVPVSPGGGDAGTMISVMVETLRVLALQPDAFEHGIIFLFNGCEENNLEGAHAFITQHPWRASAKAVLNLDAAGNGGREIMFQASPEHSWLMNYYRRYAPHPFTSAMGEELFQADLIPSDTDFRIFRDYGGVPGMDFAYSTNGYVYHTKHDTADIVPDGTLQHTGDNLLSLVKALANAEELRNTTAHMDDDAVFFDYMNWFLVYYTKSQAKIINSVVIVFCILLQIALNFVDSYRHPREKSNWMAVLCLILVQLISLLIGCGVAIGLGYFYDAIDHAMRWFSNTSLIFFLYMCPMFMVMSIGPAIFQRLNSKLSPWEIAETMFNFHSWLLIVLLVATMGLDIRSGFMVMVPLLFFSISLMIQIILKYFRINTSWKLAAHYLVQVIPFAFFSTWAVIAFATFIPIAGRQGVRSEPEFIISAFAIGMGLLLAGYLTPTIPLDNWINSYVHADWFPIYQRKSATTTSRTQGGIRREHSGFFARGYDRNNHLMGDYLDLSKAINGTSECSNEWLCGLPMLYNAGTSYSYLFDAPKPIIPDVDSDLRITGRSEFANSSLRLSFQLTCPNNCMIYISPVQGVSLGKCSVFEESNQEYHNQRLYTISYFNLYLNERPHLEFWLDVTRNSPTTINGQLINIGIAAQYTASREMYSPDYKDFLSLFPDWTTTNDWISTFKSYEF